jgi:hypothetical protein
MAKIVKEWWGFYVHLNHAEACGWTSKEVLASTGSLTAAVVAAISSAPIALAVVAALAAAGSYIRSLNEHSGGNGVRLKFLWPGTYVGVQRKKKPNSWGASKC